MGSRSRERRRAKQQARDDRARAAGTGPGARPGPGSTSGPAPGPGPAPGASRSARHDFDAYQHDRQTADLLVGAAMHAQHTQDGMELSRCIVLLTEPPVGSTRRRMVDRAFASWLNRMVERAWDSGWQPADVVRIVSREGGARQLRMTVDAIAAQMRRYAASTVDERWEAQLAAVEATVWWADDDGWLDAWGEREGEDRVGVVTCAVTVLGILGTLPPLAQLCPPPGTARRGTLHPDRSAGRTVDARMLDRVRALLAKAESTGFAQEAEALTAKAQELMARHSIDYALLAAETGSRDEPTGRRVGVDNPYETPKALLLDKVATANRCRAVWTKDLGFATVLGFESDLDGVELLYTSLLVQATTAMTREGSRQDRYGRSRTRSFRQSFLTAFAVRIGERLQGATDKAGAEAVAERGRDRLLPVLAAREDTVREATETMFPGVVSRPVTANDREGWSSGRAAAELASLNARTEVRDTRPG
ncbi:MULTISPECIES: DUF2786 domain-containing protein [unclassified Frankia]|uniref:DUF2786 domain-containing protein n=1 Tax=unclassified Frankia TaxID=2632575 RepID=UPI002AD50377|nr:MULTISPECIES: DUF2786 domain-containing protein [unclassified Frankia]